MWRRSSLLATLLKGTVVSRNGKNGHLYLYGQITCFEHGTPKGKKMPMNPS